jgi:hypothetical protein
MAQTTRTDRIATLSAVVSERRKTLAKGEARLAGASAEPVRQHVLRAAVDLDRSILASVERDLAEAQVRAEEDELLRRIGMR